MTKLINGQFDDIFSSCAHCTLLCNNEGLKEKIASFCVGSRLLIAMLYKIRRLQLPKARFTVHAEYKLK